jgi:hypothetical protein
MTYKQFKLRQLAKNLLTILAIIAIVLTASTVKAQQQTRQPNPDTAIVIHTTNNQLYQLNTLLNFASQQLVKSDLPVKDYVEYTKQVHALMQAFFEDKKAQDKGNKPLVKK